jgi:aspartate-semialdehyde dehydrogenase
MPSGRLHSLRVAVVGASSLRGKELVQTLEDRKFPSSDIVLLDASVPAGTLTEAAGEPTFIRALEEESFEGARLAFFAGLAQDAEQNWSAAERSGAIVIDLTGALGATGHPSGARPWIPALGSMLPPPGRAANAKAGESPVTAYVSPASPVIIACTLAAGAGKLAPRRLSMLLFPPVSEREQGGVEELESQTAALLSFREVAKPVFDAQVAFNLLAEYGPGAKPSLSETRATIARDVADYLAGRVAAPAIQLVQAPVFYGYSFAAFAEFGAEVGAKQLAEAFANLGVKVAETGDSPSNASVAGESEIHLARIDPDPNVAGGFWIWGAADGLRLAVTNAVCIAEEIVAKSGE